MTTSPLLSCVALFCKTVFLLTFFFQVAVNVQQWSHGDMWDKFGVEKCCSRAEAAVMYVAAASLAV